MFQPIALPFRIRQSSLEVAKCLHRFNQMHVVRSFEDPESEFSKRGTSTHRLARQYVEYLVASKQELDWSYAEELIRQPDVDEDAADIFIGWAQRRTIEPSRVFACEYKIRLGWNLRPCEDEDAVFSADLDRLDMAGDTAEILDYKSHFMAFNPTTIQSVLYPWLTWKIFPHLQTIRFTLDFMRFGIQRSRDFTRDQMERMDTYVQNHVNRLVEAYKDDRWPATPNTGCAYCHLSCPLVDAGMSRESVGQVQSVEQARAMGQQMYALGHAYKRLHAALRSYAGQKGPIDLGNDMVLGFSKQEQFEYDVRTVQTLNDEHGFAHDRTLKVATREVAKIGKSYPEYVGRAKKTARDCSKTVFKFTNEQGDPLEQADEDDFD